MKHALPIGGALMLAALAIGTASAQDGLPMPDAAESTTPARTGPAAPELAAGKAVYAHWCTPCHAPNPRLAGTMSLAAKYEGTLPAALENRTDLTPEVVEYFVRNGIAWMPPFRPTEITDAQLAELAKYLSAPLEDRGAPAPLIADELVSQAGDGE